MTPSTPPSRRRFGVPFPIGLALVLMIVVVAILLIRRPWEVAAPAAALPTNTRPITFMSNRDGDWDFYTLTPSTGALVAITNNETDEAFPTYSVDGGAISLLSNSLPVDDGRLDPFNMNADGTNVAAVQNDLPTILNILRTGRLDWDNHYALSGSRVFVSIRDLNLEVYAQNAFVADADIPGERNLSNSPAVDWLPAWSADGAQIVFSSDRDAGNQDVYRINADGTGLHRLTDDPADDLRPVFTDDGRILFYSERGRTDGGAQTLAFGALPLYLIPSVAGADAMIPPPILADGETITADVQRSPDGDAQMYFSNADGDWDIYLADAQGNNPINLTQEDTNADDLYPVWRPGTVTSNE